MIEDVLGMPLSSSSGLPVLELALPARPRWFDHVSLAFDLSLPATGGRAEFAVVSYRDECQPRCNASGCSDCGPSYGMHREGEQAGEYCVRFTLRTTRVGALFQLGRCHEARQALHETVSAARAADSRTVLLQLSLVLALDDISQDQP